jgi:hypothetical protein
MLLHRLLLRLLLQMSARLLTVDYCASSSGMPRPKYCLD